MWNCLICLLFCFLSLTACGPHVVAVVGNQKIDQDEILPDKKSVLIHAIIANEDKFDDGKMEITDKAFTDQFKDVKHSVELETLAGLINQAVMDQVYQQYGLTDADTTTTTASATKTHLSSKEKSSLIETRKAYQRNMKKILSGEKAFLTTALEVKDDQSNIREIYQKNYGKKSKYSSWLLKYVALGPANKDFQAGLVYVNKQESKKDKTESAASNSEFLSEAVHDMDYENQVNAVIEKEIAKNDLLLQQCMKSAGKNAVAAKECRREARKRFWDSKYKELGVKITDSKYQEAEKLFAENYNLDDPPEWKLDVKELPIKWNDQFIRP